MLTQIASIMSGKQLRTDTIILMTIITKTRQQTYFLIVRFKEKKHAQHISIKKKVKKKSELKIM